MSITLFADDNFSILSYLCANIDIKIYATLHFIFQSTI